MSRNRWRFSKSTIAVGIFGLAVGLLAGLTALISGKPDTGPGMGVVDDWTHHHLVFSNPGTAADALAQGRLEQWNRIVNDPRYVMQVMKRNPEQRALATAPGFATLAGRLSAPIGGPVGTSKRPAPTPKRSLKKDWSVDLNGAGVTGTVTTNNASGSPLSSLTIGTTTLNASPPTAATQTGTFSSAPLTTSSPITVTTSTNTLTLTPGGSGASVVGTASGTPLSSTTISLTTGTNALVLSNGGTAAHATGTFAKPPLTSTSIGLTSGSNALTMTTSATPSTATGTFAGIPTSSSSISITSGGNTLAMTPGGTGQQATGTFSAPPLSTDSFSITSGANTLALKTNATPSHALGTFGTTPPLSSTSISITSGTNTLVMTPNGTGANAIGTFSAPPLLSDSITVTSGLNPLVLKTNGTQAHATGTFSLPPLTSTSIGIISGSNTLTMATSATPSTATGTFSAPPLTGTSIGITSGSNTLTMTPNATGSNAIGTFSAPPLSTDSITINSGTNSLVLTPNGTGSHDTGTFGATPPLSSTSISITSGSNTLVMTPNGTGANATGTFSALPLLSDSITITSGLNTLALKTNGTGSYVTGTFSLPPLTSTSIGITSGSNTLTMTTSATPSTATGTFTTPPVAGNTVSITSGSNTLVLRPSGFGTVTVARSAGWINNDQVVIGGVTYTADAPGLSYPCPTGPCIWWGTTAANSAQTLYAAVTNTPSACPTVSDGGGPFTYGCYSNITTANPSVTATYVTGSAVVTLTNTTGGSITFTTNTTDDTLSPTTLIIPASSASGCTSSTVGVFATGATADLSAADLASAINTCNTSYSAVGATATYSSGTSFTITDTRPGTLTVSPFSLSETGSGFGWSGVTAGTVGTTNTCALVTGNTYTGTYETSNVMATLASNFNTALQGCAAAVGFSTSYTAGYSYLTLTDTTPGALTIFTPSVTSGTGIFAWGSVTAGSNGSYTCTGSGSAATYVTSNSLGTLASNLSAAINSCNTSYPAVGATASYSGSSVTVTDTTPGSFTTFSVASNDATTFSWGGVTAGTLGSNSCGSSTAGTFATGSTNAILASNLSAAINSCNTSYPAVGATSSWTSGSTFTVTNTTPGTTTTSPFSGAVSNASGIFSWGSVSGGGNGSYTCTSSTTATFATGSTAALASNLSSAITSCNTTYPAVGATGSYTSGSSFTVTDTTPGSSSTFTVASNDPAKFSWGTVTTGGNGSNACSTTTGTFATGATTAIVAGNLAAAIALCPAASGVSVSYTSSNSYLTVSNTTPGGSGISAFSVTESGTAFSWGSGVTNGTLGTTNTCSGTAPTFAGTFATSSSTTTLASNFNTSLQGCAAAVGFSTATSSNTVTVTETIPGSFTTFTPSVTNGTGIFAWVPTAGGNGSNTCSSSTVGTFATGSTSAILANNLSAAITACNTSYTAVGATGSYTSGNSFTVTDTTPGTFHTFTLASNDLTTFSWGSVTAGTLGSNTCGSSTAGTFETSNNTTTLAGYLQAALALCPAAAGITSTTSTNTVTVTDTTPGTQTTSPFSVNISNASGIFSWGSVTNGGNGSYTCTGSGSAATFATTNVLATLASNLSSAIVSCNGSYPAIGTTSSWTSGSSFTVTDTTPGTFPTFTLASNDPATFSWSGQTAGGNGSNTCGSSTAGTFATDSSTTTLASNLAAAIGLCPAAAGLSVSYTNGSSSLTVSNTTPGGTGVSAFSVSDLNTSGIFSWGTPTAGTLGSTNTCSGTAPSFSGTFETSSSTSTLASNFSSAIGACAASVGFSTSYTSGSSFTVTDTTPGDFTTFTPSVTSGTGIFSWGTVTAGTDGSGACTSSTVGKYATSNVPATLASNISAAINACHSSYSTVGATSSYGGGSTFTVTDTVFGPGTTFTPTTNASSGIFSWSGVTAGTYGSNSCSTDNATATYIYSSTLANLATNLNAAIALCTASDTGVTSAMNGTTGVKLTAATAGTGGNSIDLAPTSGYFTWAAGTLTGGLDGTTSGTTWAYWSGATYVSQAQVATNIAYTINHNSTLDAVVTAAAYGNEVVVTALVEGTGGDYATPAPTNFSGFAWSSSTLAGGTTATVQPNTYPAKYSFSSTTADCSDFVVYPTGMAGTATAASIVAYNNLYSGCGGTVPSIYWAYNTGGTISTSPIISPDGSQVAFMQTESGGNSTLAVVKWTPSTTETLTSPDSPIFESNSDYRGYTTLPCWTAVDFHNGNKDTYSQPFYDYASDDAIYVGDDAGYLHQFTGVFGGTPTESGTPTPWPVKLNATTPNKVTSPIYDPTSGYVFVGDMGGVLYSVGTGNAGTTSGSIHGTSTGLGGAIIDGPLVDGSAAMVYVFVTTNSGGNNAVFQFNTSFTGTTSHGNGAATGTTVGTGGTSPTSTYYLYAGMFDNVYYQATGTHANTGSLYVLGNSGYAGYYDATLYRIPITNNGMGTTAASAVSSLNVYYYPWESPLTEFCNNGTSDCALNSGQNATTTGTDYVFFSVNSGYPTGCTGSYGYGCVLAYNISNPSSISEAGNGLNVKNIGSASPNTGCWATGGIVVDNAVPSGTLAGASQIYFIGFNGNTAGGPGGATSSACQTTGGTGNIIYATQASQSSP